MKNILEVSGLNKSYGNFALQDVSFALPEGCITGFIGVNGAGKTTTLRTLLGLTEKESGEIRIFGMDMSGQERQIKERVGIVLDDGGFYDELTLAEMKNAIAPAYSTWCEADFREYMERFSLNPRQTINTLSKGMRAKYALALALSHKAQLLIMDEPTSGLDPLVRSQILAVLTDFMAQSRPGEEHLPRGVFFSTHITSDLDKIADMLVMIDDGRIVFQEEKDTLLERWRIVKGDRAKLDSGNRGLFSNLEETAYGFTGITKQPDRVLAAMPDAILERPSIEDIMLAHINTRQAKA